MARFEGCDDFLSWERGGSDNESFRGRERVFVQLREKMTESVSVKSREKGTKTGIWTHLIISHGEFTIFPPIFKNFN